MSHRSLLGLIAACGAAAWAMAAPPRDPAPILDLLYRTLPLTECALSPDGGHLAYVEGRPNPQKLDTPGTRIWLCDPVAGAQPQALTGAGRADRMEKRPAWSPDGRLLAFLSDVDHGEQSEVYVAGLAGKPPRRLTRFSGQIDRLRWSPDGRTIAALVIEGLAHPAGAVEAAAPDAGEVQDTYYEQRIALIDVRTGDLRLVSPAGQYVYEYDWAPDSRELACTLAPGNGDNNYWIARLAVVRADGGGTREVYRPEAQIAQPRWSPDGRTIAFVEGLMSDQGVTGGDVFEVAATGGKARDLTAGHRGSFAWLDWLPDGKILFTELSRGRVAIGRLDPGSGAVTEAVRMECNVVAGPDAYSLSPTADGRRWAMVRSSWSEPPEVCVGPEAAQVTRVNAQLRPKWGKTESIDWTSGGRAVQGWLVRPPTVDPARKYPLLVLIHGGPSSQRTPTWPATLFDLVPLAAEGYFVFCPNPCGSYGQGEAFTRANVRDFGAGDLRDIMTGVDEVLRRAPVDPARMGVGGWSYGGFMTMWTVTQTGRFKAAVAGAGISNWQSYYGENLIDRWMVPFFGATVYDDPAVYARCSPLAHVKGVKTPTLMVVGDSDKECPAPQSYEFWHALRALGVKTKLVVYPGEGHHFRQVAHVEDLYRRTLEWYDENLQ